MKMRTVSMLETWNSSCGPLATPKLVELPAPASIAAGVDQLSDIDIAGGNDAIKRSVDALEGLQFQQLIQCLLGTGPRKPPARSQSG